MPTFDYKITDRNDEFLNDDDDAIFLIASQNAEEEERRLNQARVQNANEKDVHIDLNYSGFVQPVSSTSTQARVPTGFPKQLRNDPLVDLTAESQTVVPARLFGHQASREDPTATQSSQKENYSASQNLTIQSNKIKALEKQLHTYKTMAADLREKIYTKEGESTCLRKDKKNLEEKIQQLKLQKLKDAEVSSNNHEIQRLNTEIQRLKDEKEFQAFNQSSLRVGAVKKEVKKLATMIPFFTNIPMQSTGQETLEASVAMFKRYDEPLPTNIESRIKAIVVVVQRRLAQLHLLIAGGSVCDATMNDVFLEASQVIHQIRNYVQYLESGKVKKITFDANPALSGCSELSVICFREKLTLYNHAVNTLHKNQGFNSILQPQTLFPEEICEHPRRIIAFYASIARYSRKFSERILVDSVSQINGIPGTFASILRDLLVIYVTESDRCFDYCGFVIATANLLANLTFHYDDFEPNPIIDATLVEIFRATLECRSDNPFVMRHLSEFLFNVTKNPEKPQIASRLCVNFNKKIEFSEKYKYFSYPPDACAFQLFSMYLLTAFKSEEDLNRLELELLLQTTLNINRITSNIQGMKVGTLPFLEQQDEQRNIGCSCFSTLVNALLTLNHLVLSNRNVLMQQSTTKLTKCQSLKFTKSEKMHINALRHSLTITCVSDHSRTAELARSSVTMIRDLFKRHDAYPIEKLVFANKLECICKILKYDRCIDINKNQVSCFGAYKMEALTGNGQLQSNKRNLM